jgi:phosphoserine phosphatase
MWVFDVDGTLIGSIRSEVLRPGVAELLDAVQRAGSPCALWSAGGAAYARRMAARHGIADRFVAYASKRDRDEAGRYVAPELGADVAALRRVYVDDVPAEVPTDGLAVRVRQFMGGNAADSVLTELAGRVADLIADACGRAPT